MRMQADWDDPFSEVVIFSPVRYETRREFTRASAGLLIPRYQVDLDQVRNAQKKLLPYFGVLQETANEMLEEADETTKKLSEREVCSRTIYRRPDHPDSLQEFQLLKTDNIVILHETAEDTHPLVESLFPKRHFSKLSEEQQSSLRALVQIKLARPKLRADDVPEYIRIVFPGMINSIIRWIEDNEGPIHKLQYFVRSKESRPGAQAATGLTLH